jgi:hypothetical protein
MPTGAAKLAPAPRPRGAGALEVPMLSLIFPTAEDSPTGAAEVRVRWFFEPRDGRTVPVLRYDRGRRELSREGWEGFEAAGARLVATSTRDRDVAAEALALAPTAITLQEEGANDRS